MTKNKFFFLIMWLEVGKRKTLENLSLYLKIE